MGRRFVDFREVTSAHRITPACLPGGGELHAQLDGLACHARGGDADHAPLGRAAGIAFAGRCAGYLDHAAPFLCWCGVWDPDLTAANRPPRNLRGGRKGRKQAKSYPAEMPFVNPNQSLCTSFQISSLILFSLRGSNQEGKVSVRLVIPSFSRVQ